ncbi:MAG: ribosome-associated translation inhibitor RaiA [Deltaproteobacteria bacterium]|nr:ribosome-associated translation inhibitor RaiA [Deltaproteobacteria bacterium]
MRVTVTFRHVDSTAGLRRYAEDKVERLGKFAPRTAEAHVILSVEKERHHAEIVVVGKQLTITAKEQTGDLYSAIDLALDKIERQLKKRAEKKKDRRGADSVLPSSRPASPPSRRGGIRSQRVAVKPMSVDDAAAELKLAKSDFLLFKNVATDSLNVLYRRKDGNFGLIEPEA